MPTVKKARKQSLSEEVFEKVSSNCVELVRGKVHIQYDKIYPIVMTHYAKYYKGLDYNTVQKVLMGVANYLEEKYHDQLGHLPKAQNDLMSKLPSYFQTGEYIENRSR